MPISPARTAAFDILMRVDQTDAYASELLHSKKFAKLSPADHGLLTELVMGVLRWGGVLDEEIANHIRQLLSKLDLEVLTAIRLGAYQILFLERIPTHAAINESVELVKRARKKSATGLVNAVLRKIAGHPLFTSHLLQQRGEPAHTQPSLHDAFHPEWMVKRWKHSYGKEIARKICEHDQSAPRTAARIQDLQIAGRAARGQLRAAVPTRTIEFEPGKLLSSAAIGSAGDVAQSDAFRDHTLVIQDEGSQLVALLVGTGRTILDCCAAPGGKTRILAEENPGATVVAMELHPRRAALLKKLTRNSDIRIVAADARTMPLDIQFDRILVDAPCSGTGTLARNPEIKWRLKSEDLIRLQGYQVEILLAAMKQVAAGGRVVYSTCSLEPEENQQVIEKVLDATSGFRIVNTRELLLELTDSAELVWNDIDSLLDGPYLRTIPGVHPCDGFFGAIIERADVSGPRSSSQNLQ